MSNDNTVCWISLADLSNISYSKASNGLNEARSRVADLQPREQTEAFLSNLFGSRDHTEFVYLYSKGNTVPFRLTPGTKCGNTIQVETTKDGPQLKKDRKGNLYSDRFIKDGYGHLAKLSGTEGITINHSYASFGHEKEHCSVPHLLVIEFDKGSLDKQWEAIELFKFYGFSPTAVVYSGGKSLHVWWKLTGDVDLDKWIWLSKQFGMVGADEAILGQPRRLVRCPGFYRGDKLQKLELLEPDNVYSLEQIESGLRALLDANGQSLGSFDEFKAQQEKERAERAKKQATYSNNYDHADIVALVELCLAGLPEMRDGDSEIPGTIPRDKLVSAFCGVCKVIGAELAIELFTAHSPHRNWRQTSHWTDKSEATIGGLIYLAQEYGDFKFPDFFREKYPIQTKEFDVEQWLKSKADSYKKNKALTPTQIINVDYLAEIFDTPEGIKQYNPKGKILLFKSATGTGKTTSLMRLIDLYCRITDYDIDGEKSTNGNIIGGALLGSRNGLLHNTCGASQGIIKHYNSEWKHLSFDDFKEWIALCVDSILKVPLDWWVGRIIVIDEIVSVLNHLMFSRTLAGKRREVIDRFIYILEVSSGIIGYDGHLNDSVVAFLTEVCPNKTIEVVENQKKPKRPKILFLDGTDNGENINPNDHSPLTKHIQATIAKQPILIGTDSLVFANSQRDRLNALGYKGMVISSETVGQKEVKECLRNPPKYLRQNNLDYLIMTPSAESGLDININSYFAVAYLCFFGVIDCDSQRQMIMRLRDLNCDRFVFIRSWSAVPDSQYDRKINLHSLLQAIMGEANQINLDSPQEIINFAKQSIDSFSVPALEFANRSIENWTYERFNIRDVFLDAIANDGFPLERITPATDKDEKATQKAATDAVKDRESLAIFNAPDTYLDKPHTILSASKQNDPAHRYALKKAQLVDRIPGINETPIWSPDFIRFITYSRPYLISQRSRVVLANNLGLAKKLASKHYSNMVARGGLSPLDFKAIYLEAKAIASSGILALLPDHAGHIDYDNRKLDADHPVVKEIIANCKESKVWKGLGHKPGVNAMSFINRLIRNLGHTTTKNQLKDMEGNPIWTYSISPSDLDSKRPYINAIDHLLLAKFEATVLPESDRKLAENKIFDFGVTDPHQTIATHDFEAVTLVGQKTIKNQPQSVTTKSPMLYQDSTTNNNSLDNQLEPAPKELLSEAESQNKIFNIDMYQPKNIEVGKVDKTKPIEWDEIKRVVNGHRERLGITRTHLKGIAMMRAKRTFKDFRHLSNDEIFDLIDFLEKKPTPDKVPIAN